MELLEKPSLGARIKEYFRKMLVYLKRHPETFPKVLLVVACCYFTFNLTAYSYAAVDMEHTMPAFNLFVITLLSFMSIISFVSVGSGKKKLIPIIITLAFVVVQIVLQFVFIHVMTAQINSMTAEQLSQHSSYPESVSLTRVHLVLLFVTLASIAFMPLYARLLRMINTKIKTDDGFHFEAITTADDE